MIVMGSVYRDAILQSPIRDLVGVAKKYENAGKKIYYFNIGDPIKFDFDAPEHVKRELALAAENKDSSNKKSAGYEQSQGNTSLIEAIIERENKKNKIKLTEDDVLITMGESEALLFLLLALFKNKKYNEFDLPGPGYPPYIEWTKFIEKKPVSYKQDEENKWNPDIEDLRKKINDRTGAILVINPNNPTGGVYDKSILKEIGDIAGEHNKIIISDEIYDLLIFGDTRHVGLSSLSKDVPVIGLNGFSKNYLVPGYRVGYMFFHDPTREHTDLKELLFSMGRNRLSAVNPTMKACVAALTGPQDHIEETNRKLKERGEFAYKRLNEIEGIETQKPKGAFYIFPKVDMEGRWKDDKEFCLDLLSYHQLKRWKKHSVN